ncbi:MAG: hypothetical protein H7Y36_12310 [Armatimonadetes bacterium]|nr:hypothetical protein [Akkermansiaceae bacterium]
MSGSSGGSYSSGGGGGGDGSGEAIDCYKLSERVQLSSPVPSVIGSIRVNDVLDIEVQTHSGTPLLMVMTNAKSIAGSVVPMNMASFLACIDKGVHYMAIVLDIAGGSVKVEIRPKK